MKTSILYLVLCTLTHASAEINGVKFADHPDGKISDPVDKDTADGFRGIDGYSVREVGAEGFPAPALSSDANALGAQIADLQAQLAAANEQVVSLNADLAAASEALLKSQAETAEATANVAKLQGAIDAAAADKAAAAAKKK